MATLALRAPRTSRHWSLYGGLMRIVSLVVVVADIISDARLLAHQAQERYPFTVWNA